MNKVLEKIKEGKPTFGTWIQIGHPAIAEMLAHFDFDWICVDMEHGVINIETMTSLFRAIENGGSVPFVRLPSQDPSWIHRTIDAGAKGIIAPMVKYNKEARSIVDSSKYPYIRDEYYIEGCRGVGFSRANLYGIELESYVKKANDDIMVVVQVEHRFAVQNLSSILRVRGIDATFIGPYDLSASFGKPGDFECSSYIEALEEYHEKSISRKVPRGCHIVHPNKQNISKAVEDGYTFIALGLDVTFLAQGIDNCMSDLKESLK